MEFEYRRFGKGIVRRAVDSTDDWEAVTAEDLQEAEIEVRLEERLRRENRARGPRFGVEIKR